MPMMINAMSNKKLIFNYKMNSAYDNNLLYYSFHTPIPANVLVVVNIVPIGNGINESTKDRRRRIINDSQ